MRNCWRWGRGPPNVIAAILFVLAGAWVVYVLAGYSILLKFLARGNYAEPVQRFEPRSVTVLLAVHNGERWLRDKLNYLLALDYPMELLHIIVISDGSTGRHGCDRQRVYR